MSAGEDERLRAAFRAASGTAGAPRACPDAERLWLAVHGELPAGERRELVAHTAACPACAAAWRLARELRGGSAAPASRPAPRTGRPLWAIAATLLVAVAGAYLGTRMEPRRSEYREAGSAELRPLVDDGAALPRSRFLLRWSAGAPGARYDVVATSEALRPIASAHDLEAAEWQLPAEALAGLPAGTPVLWQVIERQPEGRTVRSRTFRARIE